MRLLMFRKRKIMIKIKIVKIKEKRHHQITILRAMYSIQSLISKIKGNIKGNLMKMMVRVKMMMSKCDEIYKYVNLMIIIYDVLMKFNTYYFLS